MSDASRRTFLVAAGAGAAAVGIAAIAPGSASAATPEGSTAALPSGQPLVAYVSDASTGELSLMVGEREVKIKNHALVSQLHAALG